MSPAEEDINLNIPLNLELPEPLEIIYRGNKVFAFNLDGLAIITQMFTVYTIWADNQIARSENETIYQLRLEIYENRLKGKDEVIKKLSDDRERAYNLFNNERKNQSKLTRHNKIKTALFTSSGIIVGTAVGIIIAFIAGK